MFLLHLVLVLVSDVGVNRWLWEGGHLIIVVALQSDALNMRWLYARVPQAPWRVLRRIL